jgi:hypothetical protein
MAVGLFCGRTWGWLSLQGLAFYTTTEAGSGFFATVVFRFGVTIPEPASGAAFRLRGGGL